MDLHGDETHDGEANVKQAVQLGSRGAHGDAMLHTESSNVERLCTGTMLSPTSSRSDSAVLLTRCRDATHMDLQRV